jgi:hypothetical protein
LYWHQFCYYPWGQFCYRFGPVQFIAELLDNGKPLRKGGAQSHWPKSSLTLKTGQQGRRRQDALSPLRDTLFEYQFCPLEDVQ